MDKYSALEQYFGYTSFRDGQEELIDAILGGRDVLGVMPTGGGKSICYQIPAIVSDGVALVVSPLISLMKDQVAALRGIGVRAAYINSSLTPAQIRTASAYMTEGRYKIVYVAPERLATDSFMAMLSRLRVSLVAVDEAHCISQWGQDFRPSYLRIADAVAQLPKRPPIAAFTATATMEVRDDIGQALGLVDPLRKTTGFDRPNLRFEVKKPQRKPGMLRILVDHWRDRSGIVYCSTRSQVERVQEILLDAGHDATKYHAGLPDEERRANQDDFLYDRRSIMVATNAFGMGIDKPNVGFIIHYNMPKNLESYYQEAGRAGRDGESAHCVLLFSEGDINTAKYLIRHSGAGGALSETERNLQVRRDYARLERMIFYCRTPGCLRGHILDYFGQSHKRTCGNCGNCPGEAVYSKKRPPSPAVGAGGIGGGPRFAAGDKTGLLAALKALRLRLAREEGVPAFVVFSNATLSEMASKAPATLVEFMAVRGVGEVKAGRYGTAFIGEIARYAGAGGGVG